MAIYIFNQKNEIAERASVQKIIRTNPYTAFEDALTCKCDKDDITTPYLKVVTQITENSATIQKWLLESDNQRFFVFVNDTTECQAFNFKKDDLVLIKGKLRYSPDNLTLALSREHPSYLEYEGKKYCRF